MDGFVFFDSLVLIEVVEWDGVEPQAFSNNLTQMASLSFSLTQLHYFVTAAHTLNLTRAARECHVSQPSISGAVHHLEEMFCTQLFHRDPLTRVVVDDFRNAVAGTCRILARSSPPA